MKLVSGTQLWLLRSDWVLVAIELPDKGTFLIFFLYLMKKFMKIIVIPNKSCRINCQFLFETNIFIAVRL